MKSLEIERYQLMVEEVCKDHDCLNQKQREVLGKVLAQKDVAKYEAVVDFLFDADEIDLTTKLDLMDLV